MLRALETWPTAGVPDAPTAWLTTVARNRALDRLRREKTRSGKEFAAQTILMPPPAAFARADGVADDMLRLVFTCCHPSLARDAQLALALKTVCGLTTGEIARAFLVAESTLAQRIVRAKRKIAKANIPYRVPEDDELAERLGGVLGVIYLLFTEGHHSSHDPDLIRIDLVDEARYLARLLTELMPDQPECLGLRALIEATHARSGARLGPHGEQILLAEQDRSLWDHASIAEASRAVEEAMSIGSPGPYLYQAAIACAHGLAPSFEATDWERIWHLYQRLYAVAPTPVVAVNAAVAQSYAQGPARALASLEQLHGADGWHFYHVARSDFLERLGRLTEAQAALESALEADLNAADRSMLERRRSRLTADPI